jgi:cell wall-associated NlpC family hydrolase
VELGFRLGLGGSGAPRQPGPPATAPNGATEQPQWWSYGTGDPIGERPGAPLPLATAGRSGSVRETVVETAMAALGTRYQWGGEGDGGDGFDCSGLIQYAFGSAGISLPRTSTEQAREGREVPRKLESLAPGDLLTFAKSGTHVTHVGLYLGDGRFIHSATGGVQISRLSPDDPYGRWWWKRWVGARRIIE